MISPNIVNFGDEMPFDPLKPYNELPKLPPEGELQSLEVYKALLPAVRRLAELSSSAEALPNPNVLPETVGLLEAKASSEIENIITTTEELFIPKSIEHTAQGMTKEVKRYAAALQKGWVDVTNRPMDTPLAETICSTIRDQQMQVRKVPGTALIGTKTGDVIYTPPSGEALVRDLLGNLFIWLHEENDGLDVIVKAAILHYQFVAIHPFTDGNGRTARILTVLYLVEQNLLSAPVLFLSSQILQQKETYYKLIQSTTETGDFEPYLQWFINCISVASAESTARSLEVLEAMDNVSKKINEYSPKFHSEDIVDFLFIGPFFTAQDMVVQGVAGSLSTAYRYLDILVKSGVISLSEGSRGKHKHYINPEFLKALGVAEE
jgi:Fic family protein